MSTTSDPLPVVDANTATTTLATTTASSTETQWPEISELNFWAILLFNVGSFFFAWFLLRIVWKPPTKEEIANQKELQTRIQQLHRQYLSIEVPEAKECVEGESAGEYNEPWTKTFDLVFLVFMTLMFAILCIWTQITHPELFTNAAFWLEQIPKFACMMAVSFIGGLACRHFCEHDEKGYIITNKTSAFKVNYTRKLQHFAAYLIPLMFHTRAAQNIHGPLTLTWGNWVTLLGFLVLIKPVRERFTFFMLQFNALDRPEDRPNTISWIVGGNIIPGCILIIFFRWLYAMSGQEDMVYIFLFITGIGDGLAEPVGIYFGRHKYWTASLFGDRKYQRSFEGSACVWISSIIFTSMLWYTFHSATQFWIAMILLPPAMTYAEATSPHTLDTPFLMGVGGTLLWLISHVGVVWQ